MVGPQWMARAACRDVDPEVFFPVAESGPLREQEVTRAKEICAGCPVRSQCLAWAFYALPYGVAGGLDADERSELRGGGEKIAAEDLTALQRWSLQRGEVIAAGRRALAAGTSRARVARQFGVSRRTVDRWAAALTVGSVR
ncbi:WhiB family transcriptional regulator [Pseudonocardia terrae]|uniref:WhiB family transcriptional regulator n=1 Tax=Pseudonocardia terrae TaxID=2905831 RepID=UPI0027DED27E|nr:WhiB family transcriptional regulator [Pseudonocardia terrae]